MRSLDTGLTEMFMCDLDAWLIIPIVVQVNESNVRKFR
jgi:hypothetical protein